MKRFILMILSVLMLFTFVGCDSDDTSVTYTITFESNGGSTVESISTDTNGKATAPTNPTKEGFDFEGWYLEITYVNKVNFSTKVFTEDTIVYAKWNAVTVEVTYTITFESNGGSMVSSITTGTDGKASAPTDPTKDGYTFDGWYSDSDLTSKVDFTVAFTKDTTLYAKWIDNYSLTVVAPSGAPAMALANLEYNENKNCTITFGLEATTLATYFVNKTADVIVAPINLGAKQYNANGNYKLAASLTFGNLYLVSGDSSFDSVDDLKGKSLTAFGQSTINQYILEKVLTSNGVNINGSSTDTDANTTASDEVNITYLGSTQLTMQAFTADKTGYYLIAEPVVSTLKAKGLTLYTVSIQDEYKKITGQDYIQAACFVNVETIENHKSVVDKFIDNLEASANDANSDPETTATYTVEILGSGSVAAYTSAIPNCKIGFVEGSANKTLVDTLFGSDAALTYCGGKLPDENFYYQA